MKTKQELERKILDKFAKKQIVSYTGQTKHYKNWKDYNSSRDVEYLYSDDLVLLAQVAAKVVVEEIFKELDNTQILNEEVDINSGFGNYALLSQLASYKEARSRFIK